MRFVAAFAVAVALCATGTLPTSARADFAGCSGRPGVPNNFPTREDAALDCSREAVAALRDSQANYRLLLPLLSGMKQTLDATSNQASRLGNAVSELGEMQVNDKGARTALQGLTTSIDQLKSTVSSGSEQTLARLRQTADTLALIKADSDNSQKRIDAIQQKLDAILGARRIFSFTLAFEPASCQSTREASRRDCAIEVAKRIAKQSCAELGASSESVSIQGPQLVVLCAILN